jgi:ankyrin repeat protein
LTVLQEQQTPLHIAARLGNVDNVTLLIQHGANSDAVTKDLYTPLHIAAKEGNEEVASVLLDNGASHALTTKVMLAVYFNHLTSNVYLPLLTLIMTHVYLPLYIYPLF